MQDTTPSAEDRYYELLRVQPPIARLRTAMQLTRDVRRLAEQSIRKSHPNASDREVKAHLADRLYGREVAERLFPGLLNDA